MNSKRQIAEISRGTEGISTYSEGALTDSEGITNDTKKQKKEPKYIFIGFFTHGLYDYKTKPYKANEYASVTMTEFSSVPKLMTFMNCSPGNSQLGITGGVDNVVLKNYFKKNSGIDIISTDVSSTQGGGPSIASEEKIISNNFLGYVNSALDQLEMNPRDRNERYKKANPTDNDVCRNSFICNGKVGISHHFANKSFGTFDASTPSTEADNWGIFIYNNNCGIEPGTDIEEIFEISAVTEYDKEGKKRGFVYYLDDIIKGLTKLCGLTEDDYLFLFDYSCNNFSTQSLNAQDPRSVRYHGNDVLKKFGFGGKKKRKTLKRNKRSKTLKKNKSRRKSK